MSTCKLGTLSLLVILNLHMICTRSHVLVPRTCEAVFLLRCRSRSLLVPAGNAGGKAGTEFLASHGQWDQEFQTADCTAGRTVLVRHGMVKYLRCWL